MDTKWTPNNGGNSDNPNQLPGTGHRHNESQSTGSAVQEAKEKIGNSISDRLDSRRNNTGNDNNPTEHSDSTMSNPVNDKVDTSEKSNNFTEDNSAFDLSYFDGIYKTKEKDPLDLSYFESPYKNKLEEYLKSNVETGNQLAYTGEDLTAAEQALQNAKNAFDRAVQGDAFINIGDITSRNAFSRISGNITLNPVDREASTKKNRDLQSNAYGNLTSKEEILQKIREKHPVIANNISNNLLDAWAENAVAYNKEKQIRDDLGINGSTANSGITKAQEMDLMNRAASDYSSLSDAEKEMANRVVEYAAAHPNELNQPTNPFDTPANNRAIEERNRRLGEAITAVNTAREAERREAERTRETTPTTPTTLATPATPATPATETSETTPVETETTDTTITEDTPTTESTETETESEIPETIDEEPSEETHSVMDAIEDLDDGRRWWEFGSEDYERTRHQIAKISPTAEEEFMEFAVLINDIVNGSAGDKVKAVLKLLSKAAWDTFNILPKVCVDIAKDIVYRLIKGDYDTSGLTKGEQKQVERFSHNRQNVNMMNAILDTMDKPVTSSIRGKGRGQATDESNYNEGLIEQTNDVTSDVNKKYIINNPWIFKAIKRW